MTTPDPIPGPDPAPDDATSAYDPEAAPWPPSAPVPGAPPGAPPSAPPGAPAIAAPPPGSGPNPGGGAPPAWNGTAARPPAAEPARATPPGLVAGVILVIIGAAVLVTRVVDLSFGGATWPLWIVVPGLAMLVGSFFIPPRGGLGLAIPGAIVTMVGLILWVQEAYDLYATWAYAWALVAPTAPGLGMLLYGLVQRDGELARDGLRTTLVGLGLFLGFMLFFEGVLGLSGSPIANLDEVLPYALIGLGVLLVVLSFFGGGRRKAGPDTGS
jgi:hypothetical protein